VLRTARFFPEDDDTLPGDGENLKANEFMYRRLTVQDAAAAHLLALEQAPTLGFETFVVSAPTPFAPPDAAELMTDAPAVIARYFPRAAQLYQQRGWHLPARIDRVYDAAKAERLLGFRCQTTFATILDALERGLESPVTHDPDYLSPKEQRR
jgi:nucleoside-diphosphate-sugar epimerase